MDAQEVWHTWRRILSDPKFSEVLFTRGVDALETEFTLTPSEREICFAYSRTPKQSQWFVTNYRYRLVSSVCYALETCAPLTWRLLMAHGLDVRALAEDFLNADKWIDHGPYVYHLCRSALNYLRTEFSSRIHYLNDLIELESQAAELMQKLAQISWAPQGAAAPPDFEGEVSFQRTENAAVAVTESDVRPWLRDTSQIGKMELNPGPQYLLIYLPDTRSRVRYVSIGKLGHELFSSLEHPRTLAELLEKRERPAVENALRMFIRAGVVTWRRS